MEIVERRVRPEREVCGRERRKSNWWQFGEVSPGLRGCFKRKETSFLCIRNTSTYVAFAFIPTKRILLHLITLLHWKLYRILRVAVTPHEIWREWFGAAREDRLTYTASDCFETFPFPKDWEAAPFLEKAGNAYYRFRACPNAWKQ